MKNILIFISLLFSVLISNSQVEDIDKNTYETIVVDGKKWTTSNLNTTRFQDGSFIPEVTSEKQWKKYMKKKKPAFCYYNFSKKNGEKFGILYNWYAVNDERGLAPKGYHVATDKEWKALIENFGGAEKAGSKLKSVMDWTEDKNSDNESKFNALPGGFTEDCSKFEQMGYYGYWWSSTEAVMSNAYSYTMYYLDGKVERKVNYKYAGLSVRCVRD